MKILIYSQNYSPELTGVGKYSGEMASWLAAKNHDVRVICSPPYYPKWRIAEDYSSFLYKIESQGQITAIRCPLWVPKKPSGIKRLLHLLSFAFSSSLVVFLQLFWRPQLIFVVQPNLFCSPAALILACLCKSKTILHVQDFEVDAAFELGILKRPILRKIALLTESFIYRRFDVVSTISNRMIENLHRKGVNNKQSYLFPNWVNTRLIYPITHVSPLRKKLDIPDSKIVALYSGNMGEKQGLEIVIDAARRLLDDDSICFVLCGQGAALDRLKRMAKDLTNIIWIPLQPLDRLNELLALADIHLLPQRADAADLVMPSKLTGMLASGRPIVVTAQAETELASLVEPLGVVVPPGDLDAFVNALRRLSLDKENRERLGHSSRCYAIKNLDINSVMEKFESDVNSLFI